MQLSASSLAFIFLGKKHASDAGTHFPVAFGLRSDLGTQRILLSDVIMNPTVAAAADARSFG